MKPFLAGMLCLCAGGAANVLADQVLPDALTLNVGAVEKVGTNVTLVLTKRSVRADNYRCIISTDDGPKEVTFPVSTYRGHVQDDPYMHVNGNIEPDGILNANFSEGRSIVAKIRGMKITVPEGQSTPTMSAGNKVVPLASVRRRQVPTPGGYLIPEVPMRRTRWFVTALRTYTAHSAMEKVVSQIEQRFNDGDIAYARDTGTAWEIETLVLEDPKSTKGVNVSALYPSLPERWRYMKNAGITGVPGKNNGKWDSLCASGAYLEAGILMHESAHLYGNPWHQLGAGDGLCGGGSFWDENDVALLMESQKLFDGRGVPRDETNSPAVIYGGPLPPRASHDFANTRKDTPVTIDVLENDYDGNGDALSLKAVQERSDKGGTVTVSKDGKAIYTPAAGFVGLDKFTYTVVDSTGAGCRSGTVKVDVRDGALAVHFDFEDAEEELAVNTPWDPRPEAERLVYHFRNKGPYDSGSRGTAVYMKYAAVDGIRGKGVWNPPGGLSQAQVELGDLGDPGRGSLSASIWVLGISGGTILCKGGMPWHGNVCPVNGWSISKNGTGFKFSGNTVRLLKNEIFSLQSTEPVESNKWYHLVMVMDREAGKLRGYVNGRAVPDAGQNVVIPAGVIEYWCPLHIFNAYGGKWWNTACGVVDELKLFTCALTARQVEELYAEGRDAAVPDLKGPVGKK